MINFVEKGNLSILLCLYNYHPTLGLSQELVISQAVGGHIQVGIIRLTLGDLQYHRQPGPHGVAHSFTKQRSILCQAGQGWTSHSG